MPLLRWISQQISNETMSSSGILICITGWQHDDFLKIFKMCSEWLSNDQGRSFMIVKFFCKWTIRNMMLCVYSTSITGGNQVDDSPPARHNTKAVGAPHGLLRPLPIGAHGPRKSRIQTQSYDGIPKRFVHVWVYIVRLLLWKIYFNFPMKWSFLSRSKFSSEGRIIFVFEQI